MSGNSFMRAALLSCALLTLAGPAPAAGADATAGQTGSAPDARDAGHLKKYEGGDPWKLFKEPEVKRNLRAILGRRLNSFFEHLQEADQPELAGDVLVVSGGVRQLFTIMEGVFAVDLASGKYYAGMLDDDKLDFYGPARSLEELPPPVQSWVDDLRRRKGGEVSLRFNSK